VKRFAVLTSVTLLSALAFGAWASAQSVPNRATTKSVTSSTTPKRDRTRPYTFTTTGKVTPPPFCAAGDPGSAAGPCVPLLCPESPAAYSYCIPPPNSALCRGAVTVRFRKAAGTYTISSRRVFLKPDCSYRSQVSFRTTNPLRRGTLTVRARFEGNVLLLPRNAPTHTVRAG
jgi:hypothetical protein